LNPTVLLSTSSAGVLDITLASPESGNRIGAALSEALIKAFTELPSNTRVVRLSAQGPDFCLGRESAIPQTDQFVTAADLKSVVTSPITRLYDVLKAVPVPVLSLVRGRASGAGCALACLADLTICTDDAVFDVPEMERGVPPTLVMAALLRRIPIRTVAQLVLAQQRYVGHAALAAGIATQVTTANALTAEADLITDKIVSCSVETVQAVKTFLREAPEMPLHGASAFAEYICATALSTRFGPARQ
jgi:enoyl-CoA hydratase/carnithine racemase